MYSTACKSLDFKSRLVRGSTPQKKKKKKPNERKRICGELGRSADPGRIVTCMYVCMWYVHIYDGNSVWRDEQLKHSV